MMNNSEIYRSLQKIIGAVGSDVADNMMQVARLAIRRTKLPSEIVEQAIEKAKKNQSDVAILFAYGDTFEIVPSRWVAPECIVMTVSPTGDLREGPAAQCLPVEQR